MTFDEAVAHFGRKIDLARAIGITYTNLWHWQRLGYIPASSQLKIQEVTKGKLKASNQDCKPRE